MRINYCEPRATLLCTGPHPCSLAQSRLLPSTGMFSGRCFALAYFNGEISVQTVASFEYSRPASKHKNLMDLLLRLFTFREFLLVFVSLLLFWQAWYVISHNFFLLKQCFYFSLCFLSSSWETFLLIMCLLLLNIRHLLVYLSLFVMWFPLQPLLLVLMVDKLWWLLLSFGIFNLNLNLNLTIKITNS